MKLGIYELRLVVCAHSYFDKNSFSSLSTPNRQPLTPIVGQIQQDRYRNQWEIEEQSRNVFVLLESS